MVKIGVIGVQGDVSEHIDVLKSLDGNEIVAIRKDGIVPECDAIVIPGGESTSIGQLMETRGISYEIKKAASKGVPVLGTCAGLVLLAKKVKNPAKNQFLLGLMDIYVERNAFGRQRDSFELDIDVRDRKFHAVFIRAPAILETGDGVEVLATCLGRVVAAHQDNLLATAFHPELSGDTLIYDLFFDLIRK